MGYNSSCILISDMKVLVILVVCGCAWGAPTLVAPEPVTDTEEVVAARAAHEAAYAAAAAAAEADAVPEVVVPEGAPEPVEDTEDVAQAKADFAAAFEAQVAAVEAGLLPEVVIPEGAPESVVDSDEVAEAKAEFKAVHDAASAGATTYALGAYGLAAYPHPLAYTAHHVPAPITYAHHAFSPLT